MICVISAKLRSNLIDKPSSFTKVWHYQDFMTSEIALECITDWKKVGKSKPAFLNRRVVEDFKRVVDFTFFLTFSYCNHINWPIVGRGAKINKKTGRGAFWVENHWSKRYTFRTIKILRTSISALLGFVTRSLKSTYFFFYHICIWKNIT